MNAKSNLFKVSVSVTDSPLFVSLDYMYSGLKEAGADGVELVPGFKSRWNFTKVKELSAHYNLPITSVHQPLWGIAGVWFDEGCIAAAKRIGINTFVFHPLARCAFSDERMVTYLKRLADLQKKYSVDILLENMPLGVRAKILKRYLPYHSDATNPRKVLKAVQDFGLGITFDTSHTSSSRPQKESWFAEIFPNIKNIHLSSFTRHKDHLPLDMGDFKTTEFIEELKQRNYSGLITLEVYYPSKVRLRKYDFEGIKRSVELIKKI